MKLSSWRYGRVSCTSASCARSDATSARRSATSASSAPSARAEACDSSHTPLPGPASLLEKLLDLITLLRYLLLNFLALPVVNSVVNFFFTI